MIRTLIKAIKGGERQKARGPEKEKEKIYARTTRKSKRETLSVTPREYTLEFVTILVAY